MKKRYGALSAAVFSLALFTSPPAISATADEMFSASAFQAGTTAFRAQEYARALDAFLSARSMGMESKELAYNLGATYYRLGRYAEAAEEFRKLAADPAYAPLAHYNLGLICRKTGQHEQAVQEFSTTYDTAQEPKLKALADAQLGLSHRKRAREDRWTGFIKAGAGHDDNVSLSPDSSLSNASTKSSYLVSLLAGAEGPLSSEYADSLHALAAVGYSHYPGASTFRQSDARGGFQYRFKAGPWRSLAGVYAENLTLGGTTLETMGRLKSEWSLPVYARDSLKVIYRYDSIAGGRLYKYLSGWRQSLATEMTFRADAVSGTGGYRLELNRRDDLRNGLLFSSESPTRNRIYGDILWQPGPNTDLRFGGQYQHSRYNKPNVFMNGAVVDSATRVDKRFSLRAALDYQLLRDWTLTGEYQYLRNDSNLVAHTYASNRFLISLTLLLH